MGSRSAHRVFGSASSFSVPCAGSKMRLRSQGDGGRGQVWARETSGLKGEKPRPDCRDGLRVREAGSGSVWGRWPHWGLGKQVGTVGAGERSDIGRKSTQPGCRSFLMPEPSLAPGTSGSPVPQSHPANSSVYLAGGGVRYRGNVASSDPAVNDSWGWTPATLGFSPSRAGTSPCSCGWGGTVHIRRTLLKPLAST